MTRHLYKKGDMCEPLLLYILYRVHYYTHIITKKHTPEAVCDIPCQTCIHKKTKYFYG